MSYTYTEYYVVYDYCGSKQRLGPFTEAEADQKKLEWGRHYPAHIETKQKTVK